MRFIVSYVMQQQTQTKNNGGVEDQVAEWAGN